MNYFLYDNIQKITIAGTKIKNVYRLFSRLSDSSSLTVNHVIFSLPGNKFKARPLKDPREKTLHNHKVECIKALFMYSNWFYATSFTRALNNLFTYTTTEVNLFNLFST